MTWNSFALPQICWVAWRPSRMGMWYRFRRLVNDWHESWARLTLYQSWRGRQQERLDGTNNVTEQSIGQWVKERYRTMRGY